MKQRQAGAGGQEDGAETTGGSADDGGGAEAGRPLPDSQVHRPFSSPSPLFPPPPLSLSLSPCCNDGGDPRGSVGAHSRTHAFLPAREKLPVVPRIHFFPARLDSRSCGVRRRLGGRLGVRGDAIRETVVARQTPRFGSRPDAKATTRRRLGDAVKTMLVRSHRAFQ
jgi:hypothetical protein